MNQKTGVYRQVKIAGEDVIGDPVQEPSLMLMDGYEDEACIQYTGGVSEDTGAGSLAE